MGKVKMNIEEINNNLKNKSPEAIVKWALGIAKKPVVTTNFRPYEAAILHLVSSQNKNINVIWCDTGYNTPNTYKHAQELIETLNLKIDLYVPKQSTAHRDVVLGIPDVNHPDHKIFTEQVKLEPFKRAFKAQNPDVWFTNLRKGQTIFRDSIDVVSKDKNGVIKVSPFYNFSDAELDVYLSKYNLPNEHKYFDPTKVLGNRECGLHS